MVVGQLGENATKVVKEVCSTDHVQIHNHNMEVQTVMEMDHGYVIAI